MGNPYGFAAVCAVCFPFFFFARLYWQGALLQLIRVPQLNYTIMITPRASYDNHHLLCHDCPRTWIFLAGYPLPTRWFTGVGMGCRMETLRSRNLRSIRCLVR
jgi:hypothetical protein